MKAKLLTLLISVATLFSGMAAKAADAPEKVADDSIIEITESAVYDGETINLPSRNYTGIVAGTSGRCYLYLNGKFASTYTGLYNDAVVGWWLIVNGEVNFNYTDFYNDPVVGWWKIIGGQIDFPYTGWYESPTIGTWYVQGGQLDISKGQKAGTSNKSNTSTYNDGYSDNTYGVATGVVSNDSEACTFLVNALLAHATKLDVTCTKGYTNEQFREVFSTLRDIWYFESDYYDLRCYSTWRNWEWISWTGDERFTIDLVYAETTEQEKALDYVAAQMKAKTANMSVTDKIAYIHDYILSVNTYDYTYQVSSPYGALLGGTSVCHGYAMAFQKLAEACGITSKYLASADRAHAYNVVLLNGKWYHIDCTWDDGQDNWRNSRNYYLKGISGLNKSAYPYVTSYTGGRYSFSLSYGDY